MAIVTTDDASYKAIAGLLKQYVDGLELTGVRPREMATCIEKAWVSAFLSGQKDSYDAFWDKFQEEGRRKNYSVGFGGLGWNDETLRPKYPIRGNQVAYMFYSSGVRDFRKLVNDGQFVIDWSVPNLTSMGSMFSQSYSLISCPAIGNDLIKSCSSIFHKCGNLIEVDYIHVKSSPMPCSFNAAFNFCEKLKKIKFSPNFYPQKLDLSFSPLLTHESIVGILEALCYLPGESERIKFGSINLSKLTDAERAIATKKGWTLV